MTLEQMIEVLQAAQRGEAIQQKLKASHKWGMPVYFSNEYLYDFTMFDYRIAPKKELSLVERLRHLSCRLGSPADILTEAADRIEELESHARNWAPMLTTEELLDEIKRRMG
jgi:hypothetical protein